MSAEGEDPLPNVCPTYDTKQVVDSEAPVLEHLGMWSTPSLPLHPGSLWSGLVLPVRIPSMGQMEAFNHLNEETNAKLNRFVRDM